MSRRASTTAPSEYEGALAPFIADQIGEHPSEVQAEVQRDTIRCSGDPVPLEANGIVIGAQLPNKVRGWRAQDVLEILDAFGKGMRRSAGFERGAFELDLEVGVRNGRASEYLLCVVSLADRFPH